MTRGLALMFVVVVALTVGCGSAPHRALYTPAEVRATFAKRGVPLIGGTFFKSLGRTSTGKKFGVRALYVGQDDSTALRVAVYDRVYRKPPELVKFLCADYRPCQRFALVRNVEVFYFPTLKDNPRIQQALADLLLDDRRPGPRRA